MKLHNKNDITENKLILLYLYRKMGMMLPLGSVLHLNESKDWMTYFDLHQHINDLVEAGFLSISEDGHLITAEGITVSDEFKKRIPFSIREHIDEYVRNRKQDIQTKMQIISDYSQDSSHEFPVVLKILEHQNEVFTLRLVATSREEAKNICNSFEKKAVQLYADLINTIALDI